MTGELYVKLDQALMAYRASIARGSGIQAAKTKLTNLLLNGADDLMAAANEVADMKKKLDKANEEIQALNAALAEMDEENDALRKAAKKKSNTEKPKAEE